MDDLETICLEIVQLAEQLPPGDATYQDLKDYGYKKSFDIKLAVGRMGKILRARLAQKASFDHQATNGNVGETVLFSPVANRPV